MLPDFRSKSDKLLASSKVASPTLEASYTGMQIMDARARATVRGKEEYFTGTVWLDEIAGQAAPGRLRALRVTFEPGARTAWHTHPHGQVLHILSGVGLVQRGGEPVHTVQPGDTVWIAPGELHWHGADSRHSMVHLAMQEADETGSHATWHQQVTDAEYRGEIPVSKGPNAK